MARGLLITRFAAFFWQESRREEARATLLALKWIPSPFILILKDGACGILTWAKYSQRIKAILPVSFVKRKFANDQIVYPYEFRFEGADGWIVLAICFVDLVSDIQVEVTDEGASIFVPELNSILVKRLGDLGGTLVPDDY